MLRQSTLHFLAAAAMATFLANSTASSFVLVGIDRFIRPMTLNLPLEPEEDDEAFQFPTAVPPGLCSIHHDDSQTTRRGDRVIRRTTAHTKVHACTIDTMAHACRRKNRTTHDKTRE